ncbi:hypothetical protein LEP1GSC195_0611 [Leptospira wolbachii serovar Codice str. CDC]|uniref:Lipoprotein n=1 Tax=Leptospira wolbachii serovar Codice str. CDC TaxID=1218599 RepID=R9A934_9LEPT|nr:hypothetical protein [Leptospira wolbachii]EOQ98564.1 hypothetical protein LEP1GSC195_0611 [Leptospira wolbachii serovar Codice str. CDC]
MNRFLILKLLVVFMISVSPVFAEECEENDLSCQMQGKVESAENEPALNPDKVEDKVHKFCTKKPDSNKCLKNPDCYWDSTVKGGKCKGKGHP